MNYYSEEPPESARLSVSSVILLTIFVGAVAVIIYAWVAMPWADDEEAPLASEQLGEPVAEEGVVADAPAPEDGEVALQPAE